MAMLERRYIFQTIILGIYVRFRGVQVKTYFMRSTFSCLPPTKFKRISRHPTKYLEKTIHQTHLWQQLVKILSSKKSRLFLLVLPFTNSSHSKGMRQGQLACSIFAKCGLNMAVILKCQMNSNELLSEKPLEKKWKWKKYCTTNIKYHMYCIWEGVPQKFVGPKIIRNGGIQLEYQLDANLGISN